jgi:hypothetical protein
MSAPRWSRLLRPRLGRATVALLGATTLLALSAGADAAPGQLVADSSRAPRPAAANAPAGAGPDDPSRDAAATASLPTLANLEPGGAVDLHQDVPVTVVYVGLERGAAPRGINAAAVEAAQPATARPVALDRALEGYTRDLGLSYTYSYRSVFANAAFETAFFAFLSVAGRDVYPPTYYQYLYSQQPRAAERVTENHVIDAVAVEKWLAKQADRLLGIDTSRPTVFFINWHGRPDFQFHTYAPPHRIDGNPFGIGSTQEGQLTAWGGSVFDVGKPASPKPARVWFYDVSAGPDFTSGNWELVAHDQERGDAKIDDNRLPPIWEYGTTHWYRPFDDLSGDLADVLRYLAIDGLFTASPTVDPAISPPLLVDDVEVDINVLVDPLNRTSGNPLATLPSPARVASSLAQLDPTRRWAAEIETGMSALTFETALGCTTGYLVVDETEPCAHNPVVPTSLYDLGFALDGKRSLLLEGRRGQLPIAMFDVPDHRWWPFPGSVFTAPQASTAVQTWGVAFDTPLLQRYLYTPDYEAINAAARYLGLSGSGLSVDTEQHTYQVNVDQTSFLQLMDGTPSVTGNLPVSLQFSRFERDDMARWMTATRLQWANRILADIYASPHAGDVADRLRSADAHAGQAAAALAGWDHDGASRAAHLAYLDVLDAAATLAIDIEPWTARADEGARGRAAWAQDPVVGSARSVAVGPSASGSMHLRGASGSHQPYKYRPAGVDLRPLPPGAERGRVIPGLDVGR